jgi:hypothetical protein
MSLSFISAGTLDVPVFAFGMDVPHRSGLARFVPAPLALTSIPMTVGVLRRENGEVVIIDAGLSRAEIAGPLRELGLNGLSMAVRGGPGVSAVDQLKARGIEPEDVTTIVATHLHLDHIGGYRDFPRASVIAPAAEFAAARRLGVRAGYVHVKEILGSGRSRPVLLDREPKHGFPGWLDLFGDGCSRPARTRIALRKRSVKLSHGFANRVQSQRNDPRELRQSAWTSARFYPDFSTTSINRHQQDPLTARKRVRNSGQTWTGEAHRRLLIAARAQARAAIRGPSFADSDPERSRVEKNQRTQ